MSTVNSEILEEFCLLKVQLEQDGQVQNLDQHLENLNARFISICENFAVSSDEERAKMQEGFLQFQAIYHSTALVFIEHLAPRQLQELQWPATQLNNQQLVSEPVSSPVETMQIEQSEVLQKGAESTHGKCDEDIIDTVNQQGIDIEVPYHELRKLLEPLFVLKPIKYADEMAINQILVTITDILDGAKVKGYVFRDGARIMIIHLHRLLDVTSQSLWSWQTKSHEPTLDSFMDFLIKRAKRILPEEKVHHRSLESVHMDSQMSSRANSPTPSTSGKQNPSSVQQRLKQVVVRPRFNGCPQCGQPHFMHRCDIFKKMSLQRKYERCGQLHLCINCFSRTHAVDQCSKGPYKKCNIKHNSLLCPQSPDDEWQD